MSAPGAGKRRRPHHSPKTRKERDMTNRFPEDLIPSLAHEDPPVRSYAARLLGLDTGEQVEQYLKGVLVQGAAPLRRLAVQAMGDLGGDWTWRPLDAALSDADPAVRAQAARALGQARNPDAAPSLVARLGDGDARVRGQCRVGPGSTGVRSRRCRS